MKKLFLSILVCLIASTGIKVSAQELSPERPLSVSVIASHLAITGSPMSAATAAFAGAGILAYPGALIDIMIIAIPSCLVGILIACFSVLKKGKELVDDPIFIEKMKDPEFAKSMEPDDNPKDAPALKKGAKLSVIIFSIAVLLIVFCGAFPHMLPKFEPGTASLVMKANGEITMVTVISIITLTASALMMFTQITSVNGIRWLTELWPLTSHGRYQLRNIRKCTIGC